MKYKVGIDSNTLTYLIEAMDPNYDPCSDRSNLVNERIALLRIYLYGGIQFHVVPTVTAEYQKIKNKLKKETHESLCKILLFDEPWNLSDGDVNKKMEQYLEIHSGENDCRIVAEAELGSVSNLLTCDLDVLKHLQENIQTELITPSNYWTKLSIPLGQQPVFSPYDTNPLKNKTWWIWE